MRRRIRLLTALCLVATATATATIGLASATAAARPQTNLLTVEDGLMCVACHEPLALAQSPEAVSERAFAQQLINQGESKRQILNTMVQQYGLAVLAKPPASGFNLVVYVLPPAIVVAGALLLIVTLPKWRRRSREAARTPLPGGRALSELDADRLDADLDAWDGTSSHRVGRAHAEQAEREPDRPLRGD